jgi:hypothetical protein
LKRVAIAWTCAVLVAASGCSRKPAAQTAGLEPSVKAITLKQHSAGRVVALGDTHGDLEVTRLVLRMAGAIDDGDRWIGKDLVVVQTGDQIDRGPDDPDVIDFFERLEKEAQAAGGAVHSLLGNHEIWNVSGNFVSVTREGFDDFSSIDTSSLPSPIKQRYPGFAWGRVAAFAPRGPYALKLADRPVVLVVDASLFVHGGVNMEHVDYGLERINAEASAWLLGESEAQPDALHRRSWGDSSPTYLRRFSDGTPTDEDCAEVTRVLEAVDAQRVVVGHTIQDDGITRACEGTVWRIDVGLADYYQGPVQALEIQGDQVRILKTERPQPPMASPP